MTAKKDEGKWPFGPSPAARTWPFAEREEPVINFCRRFKHDPTHMFDTDGDGGPFYGSALISSTASTTYLHNSHNYNLVHTLVNDGVTDYYSNDSPIPEHNRSLLDYTYLVTPLKILTAGGVLLDGTGKRVSQGVITDTYSNGYVVQIQILVVPTIGRNLFSVKIAMRKCIVYIFDHENLRLEAFVVALPLRGQHDGLYSFVLDLGEDGYGATKLVIKAVFKDQI